jgi:hypothetical protein
MYDSKTTVKVGSTTPDTSAQWKAERGDVAKTADNYIKNIVDMLTGNSSESSNAGGFFNSQTNSRITKDENGIHVTAYDAKGNALPTVDFAYTDNIAGTIIGALNIPASIMKEVESKVSAAVAKKGGINTDSSFDVGAAKEKQQAAETNYTPNVVAINDALAYGESGILIDEAKTTATNLSKFYEGLGFEFTGRDEYTNDYIDVVAQNGKTKTFEISTPQDDKIKDSIAIFIKANFDPKLAAIKFAPR